jgi:sialic acid synthase SpsE
MSQVILDLSANTFKNDFSYVIQMMDEIKAIDTGKHQVIFKTQLFKSAPPNIPLDWSVFDSMYYYGKNLGYQVTSSVFDKESLDFLLQYDVPFVKLANCEDLDYLIGKVPREIMLYISVDSLERRDYLLYRHTNFKTLACISKYPATEKDYSENFGSCFNNFWYDGISDHTIGLNLFKTKEPNIWEKHYKLKDSTGLDAGEFAITPQQLAEVL